MRSFWSKVEGVDMGNVAVTDGNDAGAAAHPAAVSDQVLRSIAEQGFFGSTGSLAAARSACAELIFARAMIQAQTARLVQLGSAPMQA
jgi:hypothetical protein